MTVNIEPSGGDRHDSARRNKRQRSTIGFPYTDYEGCAKITAAIHNHVGHGKCSPGQLAAWTNQSVKSSGFRVQLAAAKLFGIIEGGAEAGGLKLTDLGVQTLDPNKAKTAKARAFLSVPLFRKLYEKYKDSITPPNAAVETEILSLGVAEKQAAKARQVFESSAYQTGFRDADPGRLVMPATVVTAKENQDKPDNADDAVDSNDSLTLDPLIMALLRKVPTTQKWPGKNRLRWFKTLSMIVSQVYDTDDESPVELNIELKTESERDDQN